MLSWKDEKKLKKFIKQLSDRGDAFERTVLKNIAETVRSEVMKRAPTAPELGNYETHLTAASVLSKEPSTAVLYTGPTIVNAKRLNSDVTLIFIREVRKETPRNFEIFEVLKTFEPYTTKTFPGNIKTKDFVLTYQKSTEKNVNQTAEKNRDTAPAMAKQLKPLGIKVDPEQYEKEGNLKLLPDLTFQVLQHELKTKKKAKPHWIPALKLYQKKTFIKKLLSDGETSRILTDPTFNAFSLSGKMSLKVTKQSVQSVTDFMDYLESTAKPKEK